MADLTDHNPNVFWELGVRQSLKFKTVTIAENGTKLPFDISTKSSLFYYPEDPIRNEKFLKNLKEAINDCINNPDKSDSTVIDVITQLGGRPIRKDLIQNTDEILKKLKEKKEKFRKKLASKDIKSELGMYITIIPIGYKEDLIKKSELKNILDFLRKECQYGPRIDSISRIFLFNDLYIERDGIWSFHKNSLIGNIYIGFDGLIIFYWNHYRDSDSEQKRFPSYDITAFLLGFLDFLYRFFYHVNYINNISITLLMKNIKNWIYSPIVRGIPVDFFYEFENDAFEPLEKTIKISTIELGVDKVNLVAEIMKEILFDCGYIKEFKIHPDFLGQYT